MGNMEMSEVWTFPSPFPHFIMAFWVSTLHKGKNVSFFVHDALSCYQFCFEPR